MKIIKLIPNTFTLLNLLCGLIAILCLSNGFYDDAFKFVCLGIFFDFWDGFLARKLNAQSDLGLQLDSLADMVTSGVVPGILLFRLIDSLQQNRPEFMVTEDQFYLGILPYLGFLVTLASCYRLANFNIDSRQTNSFIGLPTPANTLLIMSIPMIQYVDNYHWLVKILENPYVLVLIAIVSSYLLNAEIPLFSLKFKKFSWKESKLQILFVLFAAILLVLLSFIAIPIIILSYIIISVVVNRFGKK
ncbi:phosphatidylcholine/phosphatidylserine synthase [Flavobacterium sp. J27]|uniref:CDP-alcohol phosphatidyltransferase family protein n=1 Tax=Flavobacterium sp. J27 TaxID=2060419 RepID=UPI00197B01AF|nr:CDP-alcohol phosphatidyltransferase family protein [Flavobacterium sp. J27]